MLLVLSRFIHKTKQHVKNKMDRLLYGKKKLSLNKQTHHLYPKYEEANLSVKFTVSIAEKERNE